MINHQSDGLDETENTVKHNQLAYYCIKKTGVRTPYTDLIIAPVHRLQTL